MLKRALTGHAVFVGLICLVAMAHGAHAQSVSAVPKLDLNRVPGTWYEIARYPNKRQKSCIGDSFQLITAGEKPNQLLVVNSCNTKSSYPNVSNARIKTQDKSGDGKLKLRYSWPFSSKYWVLALGPDYEWALIGSPNHKTLWIIAKLPKLNPDVLADIEAKATAQGFSIAKLVLTPQSVRSRADLAGSGATAVHGPLPGEPQ